MDIAVDQRLAAIEHRLKAIEQHLGIDPVASLLLPDGSSAPPPSPAVMEAISGGNPLQAIAAYRAQTGYGLQDAKLVIDLLRG
jgi:ribosomal protein L7/L12